MPKSKVPHFPNSIVMRLRVLKKLEESSLKFLLVQSISLYQNFVSPLLGMRCRFYPTCSEYARQCFLYYPLPKALLKSCYRILRCQPFARAYEDDPLLEYKQIKAIPKDGFSMQCDAMQCNALQSFKRRLAKLRLGH